MNISKRPKNLVIKEFKPILRYIYHKLGASLIFGSIVIVLSFNAIYLNILLNGTTLQKAVFSFNMISNHKAKITYEDI